MAPMRPPPSLGCQRAAPSLQKKRFKVHFDTRLRFSLGLAIMRLGWRVLPKSAGFIPEAEREATVDIKDS